MEFKADFHCVSMRAQKDPDQKWYDLPYLATDEAIMVVLHYWLAEWCMASNLTAGSSKSTAKRKKEYVRLNMEQLAKKRKKEAKDKVKANRTTKKQT